VEALMVLMDKDNDSPPWVVPITSYKFISHQRFASSSVYLVLRSFNHPSVNPSACSLYNTSFFLFFAVLQCRHRSVSLTRQMLFAGVLLIRNQVLRSRPRFVYRIDINFV
jgi:hypothetical protein